MRQARLSVQGSRDGAGAGDAPVGGVGPGEGIDPGADVAAEGEEGIVAGDIGGRSFQVHARSHDVHEHAVQVQVQFEFLVRDRIDIQ